jgi:hypothetical protein
MISDSFFAGILRYLLFKKLICLLLISGKRKTAFAQQIDLVEHLKYLTGRLMYGAHYGLTLIG